MATRSLRPPVPASEKPVNFEEYQHPDKELPQRKKPAVSAASTSTASAEPATTTRATRAWKLVDANRILTKRKYVKKKRKAHSVSGSSDDRDTKHELSEDSALIPAQNSSRSLSWPSPESDIRTGGLRGDPFACYPDNSPSVHTAIDFLVKEIGANAVPGTIHKSGFSPKASAFIQLGFEHDLVFHALVAFAQGYDEVAATGTKEPSSAVLYHRGKATQLLCERLQDPITRADDASILTTFLLIDNVWRYGENDIGRAHYAGLLQMIEMRGGLDQLGVNGVLRSIIEFAQVTDIGDSMRSPMSVPLPALTYFKHPFPAHVCGLIARLPDGYAEMAMTGCLSIETLATIVSLRDWLSTEPSSRSPSPHQQIGQARRCMAATTAHRPTEEAVCFGLVITGMRSFHARFARMDQPFLDRIVELGEQFDRPAAERDGKQTAERQHIAYLTMVAVEASDRCIELQGHVKELVDLLLRREKFARTWEGMERALKRFFWIDFAVKKWKDCWIKHLRRRAEEQAIARGRAARSSEVSSLWATINTTLNR